ncbi:MAG TPA: type II methionyl aminopeptidase [Euryarchaeota archaeon]|nr:methionine aminopeptidase [archaeon BMS3Bbin16]HDH28341.1 type II methionyl aminopeptidase [Euryarchaeota archaeon]
MAGDDKLRDAGSIAAQVMDGAYKKVKEGARLLEVADYAEALIVEMGARPAFPMNISINERAAHYTPDVGEQTVFEKGDLVKLDIGVHVDGYIGDIARSKAIGGGHKELIAAAEAALENAVSAVKPGVRTNEVGGIVEKTIKDFGLLPVSNLTGHMLTEWNLHGGTVVPNVRTMTGYKFRVGDVFAIEPFSTNGAGRVVDEASAMIFRYLADKPLRMREARTILAYAKENFSTLPFAERWVAGLVPRFKLGLALRQLVSSKSLHAYHILRECERGLVAQAEHSIRVTNSGCEILTEE